MPKYTRPSFTPKAEILKQINDMFWIMGDYYLIAVEGNLDTGEIGIKVMERNDSKFERIVEYIKDSFDPVLMSCNKRGERVKFLYVSTGYDMEKLLGEVRSMVHKYGL